MRTIFNLLGPLLNPAGPDAQVIGVATEAAGHLIAKAAAGLRVPRVFVVHGAEGWDEPTPVGPFRLWSVESGEVQVSTRDPAMYGVPRCLPEALRGGDPATNAQRMQAVLTGQERGAHRDAVLLGAALTLEVAGVEADPVQAFARSAEAIDQGRAGEVFAQLRGSASTKVPSKRPQSRGDRRLAAFVADSQRRVRALASSGELARRVAEAPPVRPLVCDRFGIIAEVKFRAPSVAGLLGAAGTEEAVVRAQAYSAAGASAVSVLTCPEGFDGHIDHLRAVAASVDVPVMRKDFLIDPRQVLEARLAGASGVLLVARILDDLSAMLEAAREAELFALVEVFDEADLERITGVDLGVCTSLVGVNARCLDTLTVRTERHRRFGLHCLRAS